MVQRDPVHSHPIHLPAWSGLGILVTGKEYVQQARVIVIIAQPAGIRILDTALPVRAPAVLTALRVLVPQPFIALPVAAVLPGAPAQLPVILPGAPAQLPVILPHLNFSGSASSI
jgi:hypothetical protein